MRNFILICILLILNACSGNSEKDRYVSIVEEWQGKQIVLPDDMTDFLTGDTIDLIDSDFTIISYADSVGCTGCKMKLPLWKEFLSSIDSVSDSDVRFLMIVHPHGTKDLDFFLKQDEFSYAVYLDSENKISVANSFPEETAFQTFLIDRNRKVTAVGNPVYSSPIAELYKEIISGQMSVSAKSRNVVSVSDNRINLGSLNSGRPYPERLYSQIMEMIRCAYRK